MSNFDRPIQASGQYSEAETRTAEQGGGKSSTDRVRQARGLEWAYVLRELEPFY